MNFKTRKGYVLLHMAVGAAVGYALLHPVTMLIYSYESGVLSGGDAGVSALAVVKQLVASFLAPMLPMSFFFILLGAALGGGAGMFSRAIAKRDHVVKQQERQLEESVGSLIREGENYSLEFKSSLRWDLNKRGVNKALEVTVVKTIAGFMNGHGGTLLIGIDDAGQIRGIEMDYSTLRKENRDGFQQKVQQLVATNVGGDACAMVHVLFHRVENRDVCRVYVESSLRPVYVRDNGASLFYLRTGNATRQLDVQEAIQHITSHWKEARI